MPTASNEVDILVDTSVAVAVVVEDHEHHGATLQAIGNRSLGLAGHAAFETFSVLTRLPPPVVDHPKPSCASSRRISRRSSSSQPPVPKRFCQNSRTSASPADRFTTRWLEHQQSRAAWFYLRATHEPYRVSGAPSRHRSDSCIAPPVLF